VTVLRSQSSWCFSESSAGAGVPLALGKWRTIEASSGERQDAEKKRLSDGGEDEGKRRKQMRPGAEELIYRRWACSPDVGIWGGLDETTLSPLVCRTVC